MGRGDRARLPLLHQGSPGPHVHEDARARTTAGGEFLRDFYKVVSGLGDKLGAVLFQPHTRRKRDDEDLAGVPRRRHRRTPVRDRFPDESWDADDVRTAVAEQGAPSVTWSGTGKSRTGFPPGPIAYVRLRSERYEDGARTGWRELLETRGLERDVYVFAKHEGIATADTHGGVGLARWLREETAGA